MARSSKCRKNCTGQKKPEELLEKALFLTFAKIGLFTFGGGYAMISMMEHICVEDKKWISHDEMMDITVIAESTPGPIAINCATFVGYKQKGFLGAAAATAGIVFPSFAIIYLLAKLFHNFLEITVIANAFRGIKLAVGILILDAAFKMIQKMPKKRLTGTIMVSSAVLMFLVHALSLKYSSIRFMLIAGMISLVMFMWKGKSKNRKDGNET